MTPHENLIIKMFFVLIYFVFSFIYFTFIAFKALKNLENQQYDLLKDNLEKIAYFWLASIIFGLLGYFLMEFIYWIFY